MKFFVSGKVGSKVDAQEVMARLKECGHSMTFEWTSIEHLKPYDERVGESREAAVLESQGVREADVLVVCAHPDGVGMYVELGIAIGCGKPIVVLSEEPSRSMFFHHPLVTRLRSLEELAERYC